MNYLLSILLLSIFSLNFSYAQNEFKGGTGDGYHSGSLTDLNNRISFGGNEDGYSCGSLLGLNHAISFGGNEDGYSCGSLLDLNHTISFGGNEDGYSCGFYDGALICSAYLTNNWQGGSGDWNDPTKWSLGVKPTYCHDVRVHNTGSLLDLSAGEGYAHSISLRHELNVLAGAKLRINGALSASSKGIAVAFGGELTNQGEIYISNATSGGMAVSGESSMMTNAGNLFISNLEGINADGIAVFSSGEFTNLATGVVTMNNIIGNSSNAIVNLSSFTNAGMFTIDNNEATVSLFNSGASAMFINTNTGFISIRNTLSSGLSIQNRGGATLHNSGTIKVIE